MSEYNPCSVCGYDSSAYKALKENRDELLEKLNFAKEIIELETIISTKQFDDTIQKTEAIMDKEK